MTDYYNKLGAPWMMEWKGISYRISVGTNRNLPENLEEKFPDLITIDTEAIRKRVRQSQLSVSHKPINYVIPKKEIENKRTLEEALEEIKSIKLPKEI